MWLDYSNQATQWVRTIDTSPYFLNNLAKDFCTQIFRKSSQVTILIHEVLRAYQIKIKEALKSRKQHICHCYRPLEPPIKSL